MSVETVEHRTGGRIFTLSTPVILMGLLVALGAMMLIPGHLAATTHVIDILHATSLVFRMLNGEQPHIDFMTPLGIMTIAPMTWLVQAGFDIARAYLAAGILIALLMMPAILRIASSRLSQPLGLAFGIGMIVMTTSLVYGGTNPGISISMFYNRWAWAAAAIVVLLLILPAKPGRVNPVLDGGIIGAFLGYLVLLKLTYFVALAPVVAIGLCVRKDWVSIIAVGAAGLVVAVLATLAFGGLAFWQGYIHDILMVAASENRAYPGLKFHAVLSAPAMLPATICALVLVVTLRMAGADFAGLVTLLLFPGFAYIAYQNWGNDPKWLLILAIVALAQRPAVEGKTVFNLPAPQALALVATASLVSIAPSATNLVISPFRNLVASSDRYVPILTDPQHRGLLTTRKSAYLGQAIVEIDGTEDPVKDDDAPEPILFSGMRIQKCYLHNGYVTVVQQIADDLTAQGYAGQPLLYVDVYDPLPLLGDFDFLPGRAPWYYGGPVPSDQVTAVVVPKCGSAVTAVRVMLEEITETGSWQLVADRQHHWVFKPL